MLHRFKFAAFAAFACLSAPPSAAADGDPAAGKKVFAKCAACHTLAPDGKHRIGPNLFGVIGRPAGTAAGYSYSPAMRSSGIVWSPDSLDSYLANPKAAVPGNKMPFPGLASSGDRGDLIAYLAQMGPR
jgi:cytochrome c2